MKTYKLKRQGVEQPALVAVVKQAALDSEGCSTNTPRSQELAVVYWLTWASLPAAG